MKVTGGYSLGGPIVYESDNTLSLSVNRSLPTSFCYLKKLATTSILRGKPIGMTGMATNFSELCDAMMEQSKALALVEMDCSYLMRERGCIRI